MIVYALRCDQGHRFDGWFRSSDAFEQQQAAADIACPDCGSSAIAKAPMAPRISKGREAAEQPTETAGVAETGGAPSTGPARGPAPDPHADRRIAVMSAVRERLEALRRHVEAEYDYVGEAFPEEARRIHYGETARRDIYGEAAPDEVAELLDEGVGILPLPAPRRTDS